MSAVGSGAERKSRLYTTRDPVDPAVRSIRRTMSISEHPRWEEGFVFHRSMGNLSGTLSFILMAELQNIVLLCVLYLCVYDELQMKRDKKWVAAD